MFHFPAFPPHTLCIQVRVTPHDWCQVPPFGHPGITARLTAPPGLSRPPTSFIGSWCQGIHRSPLTTYTTQNQGKQCFSIDYKLWLTNHRKQDARVHYTILNPQPTHNHHDHTRPDTTSADGMQSRLCLAPKKQPPHPPQHEGQNRAVPSGLNRVFTANHQPHHNHAFHHPQPTRMRTHRHDRRRHSTNQCLRQLSTPTRQTRIAGSSPAFAGRCSLERR
jgi:hypothetical protein